MATIPWLDDTPGAPPAFPPTQTALLNPNGLLAAGGQLTPEWLLAAYRHGIFPWFSPEDPILWWSPSPRMVVFPDELRITRSLRKTLKSGRFEVRYDTAFTQVMECCAQPRGEEGGTWIVPQIIAAYTHLHELGWAHSVESWLDGQLVGGLYGVAIGQAFYGESMFHSVTDASKVAFAHLVRRLQMRNFAVIDCQMKTSHLASLGGREMDREEFVRGLAKWAQMSETQESTPTNPQPARWLAEPIDWS